MLTLRFLIAASFLLTTSFAQTFRRTAACPKLGCIFPPVSCDTLRFVPDTRATGSNRLYRWSWVILFIQRTAVIIFEFVETFDIRIEVQAPFNGTEAYASGTPSPDFSLTINGEGGSPVEIAQFFGISDPKG